MNLKSYCLLFLLLFGGDVCRAVGSLPPSPYTIPFQGRLTNQQGVPYEKGQYTVVFNIYSQAVGGATKWTERHENVGVTNGMISVFLGSIAPLPTTEGNPPQPFFASARYLGITVDVDENAATADPEMVPRQMIIPAFHAKNADKLASPFGYRDWSSLFGSGKDPATSEILLSKVPPLDSAHLPDDIPGSKLANDAALENFNQSGYGAIGSGGIIFSATSINTNLQSAGYQRIGEAVIGAGNDKLPSIPLSARMAPFAAWTGTELLVWGGGDHGEPWNWYSNGARYNPSSRQWTLMNSNGAPSGRRGDDLAGGALGEWTGQHFIVWGGYNLGTANGTGGMYSPATDSWTAMSTTGAPDARHNFAEAWTGSRYLVWGGFYRDGNGDQLRNNGARFDPLANVWSPISSVGAPTARAGMAYAWTGTELFIWGGNYSGGQRGDGALYNPQSNTWRTIPTSGAPSPRESPLCVWTGSKVFVWGGNDGTVNPGGALYDPATNLWQPVAPAPGKSNRYLASAVWTGEAVVISGGFDLSGTNPTLSDGAAYFPATNSWLSLAPLSPAKFGSANLWIPPLNSVVSICGTPSATTGGMLSDISTLRVPRLVYLYQRP